MIKLGDTVDDTRYGEVTKMRLCKQPSLKRYTDMIYIVLGFYPGKGWAAIYNNTLANCRKFIEGNV